MNHRPATGRALPKGLLAALAPALLGPGCALGPAGGQAIQPGLYQQRAALCTPAPRADAASACPPTLTDCLLIQRGPDGGLRLELFSTQAHQHVCVVSARARADGAALRVDDPDTPGQGLRVARDGDALRLSHLAPARPGLHPFCGASASLDGYRFALSSRQAEGGACVPAEFK